MRFSRWSTVWASILLLAPAALPAQQATDVIPRIPPAGIKVPEADRKQLQDGVAELGREVDALRETLAKKPDLLALLPDVQIFHNAVRYALAYDEFFKADEIGKAHALLQQGMQRAKALREGNSPWTKASGLIVRGYISKIDGSVQPYGLVVPPSVEIDPARPRRLDIWYHGRGETLNEINFLTERRRSPGDFAPADTIVLHPYGRYCNANRFAGEVDTFEALDSVRRSYAIDENRILVRGFSMGGAACWSFATHHSGLWAGAAPGAGFSETAGFLHISDLNSIPWYQRKLWHWYDSTDYAINLFNCPTVAYSGAADPQKQAADEMAKAMAGVGMQLEHVIGPGNTKHWYEATAKLEVARRMDAIARHGRDPMPHQVKFKTWTLRYNQMRWVTVDALEHHWDEATVDARIAGRKAVEITTQNISGLTLCFAPGDCPLDDSAPVTVTVDHHPVDCPGPRSDRSWQVSLRKSGDTWAMADSPNDGILRKRHGLQGPIDDAFMDSFIMVSPTGKPMNPKTGDWVKGEMAHAVEHWRRQFRGEARVKDDTAITDSDIASSNLVLWGDPSSNSVLKKVVDRLPIHWDDREIRLGNKGYPASTDMAVMIYPNPLNSRRYIVLNSGFTFREYDYLNNARQTPKLPDWAVIDTAIAPSSRAPGGIANAGFFGEKWELTEDHQNAPATAQ
jgi:pimeloyl-ACP methyl ester carboxylesterase